MNDIAVTRLLAEWACNLSLSTTSPEARTVARQCVMDYLGVTLAGSDDPPVRLLREELLEEGGAERASILGSTLRMPLANAALLNGMAAHALDYDDVNYALMGHPSVPILPALMAQAEAQGASGAELVEAFLAGYEVECRVGLLVAPGHYAAGFHATATVGAIGAAVACAKLLGAAVPVMAQAIGIAATQAAGLKSMFGTACKPFHAGLAARSGLMAARLAVRGFDSRLDALECAQGFAATHSVNFAVESALAEPPGGFHILANLFKYHASCYETHATIECGRALRSAHGLATDDIAEVDVTVNPYCDRICNLQQPTTGLESKFSLRQTAAMALAGVETADPAMFCEATAQSPALESLRDRIRVGFSPEVDQGCARMRIRRAQGDWIETRYNAALPWTDLEAQGERLLAKFTRLAEPVLGVEQTAQLAECVDALEALSSIDTLVVLATT